MSQRAIEALKSHLGPQGWLQGEEAALWTRDVRGAYGGQALLVARPGSTEEVATTVRICRAHAVAIVPQGGNTGLCGGAVPLDNPRESLDAGWGGRPSPCIVLSLARMNRIVSIDPLRYTVTAEAGCVVQAIQEAAADVDRVFALDWGARGSAAVGGAISTNAGGINVLRFGNTREQVLGLEVVLPDGRVWDGLRALRKDSSGLDLKQLFIGAEGTLGIVTRAVLRLHPRPPREQTLFGAVGDISRLMDLFALARSMGDAELSAFELIPGDLVDMAIDRSATLIRPMATSSAWHVLVRFSGQDDVTEKLELFFVEALDRGLITDAALAGNLAQEQNLWDLRDAISPMRMMTGKMLKWDASVPIDCIIPFLDEAQRRACAVHPPAKVIAFGHVGDGNLHLSVWPELPEDAEGHQAFDMLCERIVKAIDALVWEFGGSICAEHGVGVENISRLRGQKAPLEFEMMAKIKSMFDPDNLFNPGKVFDPSLGKPTDN
jgi:FAD/FMN-containing dehydrogenase